MTVAPSYPLTPARMSLMLTGAAQHLRSLGRGSSAHVLLKHAVEISPEPDALRELFLSSQAAADVDLAFSAYAKLLEAPDPGDGCAEAQKLRSLDLRALQLLSDLPQPEHRIRPVPGRLVYLLHHSRPHLSNGYATRGQGLATGMKSAGLDLHCMTRPGFPGDLLRELGPVPAEEQVGEISYIRLPSPKRFGPDRSRRYFEEAAAAIEARLREVRPQALMVASNYVAAMPALMAARRVGIPLAYEVRGFWEITQLSGDTGLSETFDHNLKVRIESEVAAAADHVFTLSASMAEELALRGADPSRISLIPNSVDPTMFASRPRDEALARRWNLPPGIPVIGYVGSFVQYEGLDDLTRACAALRRQGRELRLVLVGNEKAQGSERGPVTQQIERIAHEEGLTDWLVMPGRVPHEEVESWYSLIDIAPFPRKPQAVTELVPPLKPLEAMAMEKAVVVSSVRALAEGVIDGETGLIFRKGDTADLTSKLALLIDDEPLRSRLAASGGDYVRRERTWAQMGERVKAWLGQN